MADDFAERRNQLGVVAVKEGGYILDIYCNKKPSQQYPYDCPHSHCAQDSQHCRHQECSRRLHVRHIALLSDYEDLWNTLRSVATGLAAIKEAIAKKWEDIFRPDRAAVLKAQRDMHLDEVKDEILGLEDQVKMLQLDEKHSKRDMGRSFWTMVDSADEQCPCACDSCLAGEKTDQIMAAIEEAGVYKERLNGLLGIDGSGKSSLERERERIREIAQRDSPFGRVGSYRGFGAGALKPRTGTAANSQPQKTTKKTKKPSLTW